MRISRGWTQEYVGQQAGVSKVAIHDIETGKQKPSYSVLLKLLTLFTVEHENISQLFVPVEETQPDFNTDRVPAKARKNFAVAADLSAIGDTARRCDRGTPDLREGRATQERDGATAK
jgi:transcriptional regulator with XRE-family HTH domain